MKSSDGYKVISGNLEAAHHEAITGSDSRGRGECDLDRIGGIHAQAMEPRCGRTDEHRFRR